MNRVLCRCALALLLSLAPAVATSAEGIGLAWYDCRTGSGTVTHPFACGENEQVLDLFCSFQPGGAFSSNVVGIEAIVDVQHSLGTLPDWWQMGGFGCRAGQLVASADFSLLGDCADPWGGLGGALVQGYDIGQPRGGANQVRIKAAAGVLPKNAVSLSPSENYYGINIRIFTARTTGGNSCTGCSSPACLVLNGIIIRTLGGTNDVTLATPAFDGANIVPWRGDSGADCGLVPVRTSSWGLIKTLYR